MRGGTGSKPIVEDTDIERTIRKISQLAEIEQSFDAMRTDVAAASKEVSRLSETARDSAARIDATLAAFRAAVERLKQVEPEDTKPHLDLIQSSIAAFESEIASLERRFGRMQPSIDRSQETIEQAVRSVVSDAEEEIEAEIRWMKHSLRKKMSEQSIFTNKNIEMSTQRVTEKVGESHDYLRNLLYLLLFFVLGSIAAQVFFAFG
jgi:ABC-type transporter Mla subunit MlaD